MATATPSRQTGVLLDGSVGDLLVVPSTVLFYVLTEIWLTNVDSVDRAATLYLVGSGEPSDDAHTIVPASTIKTGGLLSLGPRLPLLPSDKIRGFGSAANKISVVFAFIKYT